MDTIANAEATQTAQSVETRLEDALFPSEDLSEQEDESPTLAEDEDSTPDEEVPDEEVEEEEAESEDELSLADYLGVPEDRLVVGEDGQVKLLAKVDGEMSEVELRDLVKSYQLEKHVNNKSMQVQEERKDFETKRTEAVTELREYADKLTALSQVMEQELFTEFSNVDWDRLRSVNPAEWAAKREEFALRAQRVQTKQQEMVDTVRHLQQQQQTELDANRQNALKERDSALIGVYPEWADEVVRDKAFKELGSFLTSEYNMPEDALENTFTPDAIKLAMDAKAYRQGKQAAAGKKAKPVPKFQKSGAARASAANLSKARQAKEKRAALKKSGGVQDAANLLLDRM